ncbi:MAG: VOC family protein [Ferruginibacter sp.]
MKQRLAQITIVVKDYDEAIDFYVNKLGFTLVEDTVLTDAKRWVKVAPAGSEECCLLLAKAANEKQISSIGNQTGGRVFLFLQTDDFWRDYSHYRANDIHFVREPVKEEWGTVAVFEDLYGNLWDLIGSAGLKG